MTNGDRLRSMTDEELAKMHIIGRPFCNIVKCEEAEGSCYKCALSWLKGQEDDNNVTYKAES